MSSPIQIEESFIKFLLCFKDEHHNIKYKKALSKLVKNEKKSIIIDFRDLYSYDEDLANLVLANPKNYLPHLNFATLLIIKNMYPIYTTRIKRIHVRFRNLPLMTLIKHLGIKHIGRLIMVQGIITRTTAIYPLITMSAHRCITCNEIIYQKQSGKFIDHPSICPSCKTRIFDLLIRESDFVNSQMITIQEFSPQKSKQINVQLSDDIVNIVSIGNRVNVIGFLKLVKKYEKGFIHRIFNFIIEANNIEIIKNH